jgi:APA family basic amino acid/polyamine antiporter
MGLKHLFAKKDLEMMLAEMAGEHRLHRVLGPVSLTALGVGCIIGAGIFVATGRAAAQDAGPAVVVSYVIAALGCALAALCYAEFAAMAPVAGSAYTYAYTTLGEIFAWIIGWDLILEYAMGCATVAAAWSHYLNEFLKAVSNGNWSIPAKIMSGPFTKVEGLAGYPWLNLPSVLIMILVTTVLVLGIRESARTNALLVAIKLAVVIFVIGVGWAYVDSANWTSVPFSARIRPEERDLAKLAQAELGPDATAEQVDGLAKQLAASYRKEWASQEIDRLEKEGDITSEQTKTMKADLIQRTEKDLPSTDADKRLVHGLMQKLRTESKKKEADSWGLLGYLGLNQWLLPLDDAARSPFMPYGLSGIMLGASIVFFAYIGFDSISTHAEEAKNPQRDVPIGILTSLTLCTVLYVAVAAVVTGIMPYPSIDVKAPIAVAFHDKAAVVESPILRWATVIISIGGLAGMTSVLLVLFLSQARIFMAMARDGLLPSVFGRIHPRFRTPHIATMVTGVVICVTAAFTPIYKLEEMVNVGTLMAFIMVCAAVLVLRFQRPNIHRPFRCPLLWLVAPLGILVNLSLMLFLPIDTWLRLVVWLLIGFVVYFSYSWWHSRLHLARHLIHEIQEPRDESVDGVE